MKSRVLISLFCLATLFYISCKKKAINENNEIQANSPVSYNPKELNGYLLKSFTNYFINDTFRLNVAVLQAAFFDTLIDRDSILYASYAKDVGEVYLNDSILEKNFADGGCYYGYYNEWKPKHIFPPFTWKVTGKNDFAGINFLENTSIPAFNGAKHIIDTLVLGNKNTLEIDDYKNADKIEVQIDGTHYGNGTCRSELKTLLPPLKKLEFTVNEIFELSLNWPTHVDIEIRLIKSNFQVINGKVLNFKSIYVYIVPMIPTKV